MKAMEAMKRVNILMAQILVEALSIPAGTQALSTPAGAEYTDTEWEAYWLAFPMHSDSKDGRGGVQTWASWCASQLEGYRFTEEEWDHWFQEEDRRQPPWTSLDWVRWLLLNFHLRPRR